jgi:glycosyltransferase involved in cell wall biosynthesis
VTRLAVVIPTFNDGDMVADAVASVREDERVEVVVVDDGTTDVDSLAVLDQLRDESVAVVVRPNGGPGAARMTGVSATKAPFLFPLDADDLLVPGVLARLADLLEENPQAGVAWGDYTLFGDYAGRYHSPSSFLPWSVTWVNPYPICSLLRRSALEAVGGWAEADYEDWGLWLAFVEHGIGGVSLGDIVYRRRLHGADRAGPTFRRRHKTLYRELQDRHPKAFARRRELRRQEGPPAWKRVVYPVLFGSRTIVPFRVEAWMQRTMMRRGLRLSR